MVPVRTNPSLTLDIVIPTFNRSRLLRELLASIACADRPESLTVGVIVVDNNSSDDTAETIRAMAPAFPYPLRYELERRQGSSWARNRGIDVSESALVGMVDDDEQIAADWLAVVYEEFSCDPGLDFIGGRYDPRWESQPPAWLPSTFSGVLAIGDPSVPGFVYSSTSPSLPLGGNSVFRRCRLVGVGGYDVTLGRVEQNFGTGEDYDLARRLVARGAIGRYVPELSILHTVSSDRLSRWYFREWVKAHGLMQGASDAREESNIRLLAGVPRWRLAHLVRSVLRAALPWATPSARFESELHIRHTLSYLAGYRHGKPGPF